MVRVQIARRSAWRDGLAALAGAGLVCSAVGAWPLMMYFGYGSSLTSGTGARYVGAYLVLHVGLNALLARCIDSRAVAASIGAAASIPASTICVGLLIEALPTTGFTLSAVELLALGTIPAITLQWALLRLIARRAIAPSPESCLNCGYNREGLPRCPECGHP